MDDRTKTFYSFIALAAVVTTAGCGYNQQARYQMSFLPAAPHAAASDAGTLPSPPHVQPNLYIQQTPAFILASAAAIPPRKTAGDQLVMRAEQTFQQGKRFYQANDVTNA